MSSILRLDIGEDGFECHDGFDLTAHWQDYSPPTGCGLRPPSGSLRHCSPHCRTAWTRHWSAPSKPR
ncbi:hypothetical protein ACF068_30615 [Streptomyces sp. NPDC016309]|uniref:hypothetical protein n=1 Tax=Streptomyces sp. NPDC016309 TaxID=3364965 RepID=UPI0036F60DE6